MLSFDQGFILAVVCPTCMAYADIHTCKALLLIRVDIDANQWVLTVLFVREKVIWTVPEVIKTTINEITNGLTAMIKNHKQTVQTSQVIVKK